jgi:hypothetical protein
MSDDVVASLGPVMYAPRHGQYNPAFDYTGTFCEVAGIRLPTRNPYALEAGYHSD